MSRHVVIGLVVAAVGICLCIGVGAVALLLYAQPGASPSTAVTIDAVTAVPPQEPFELTIRIENLSPDQQTLDSIDIENSYLEGITVRASSPAFLDQFPILVFDYQSFIFQQAIPSGETLEVTFLMEGEREGRYIGAIDVCINSMGNCTTQTLDTTIGEASGR